MTASMYQGEAGNVMPVGAEMNTKLPGPTPALQQGSQGPTMSDLQFMMENERKQHQQGYQYMFGHNDHGMGQ